MTACRFPHRPRLLAKAGCLLALVAALALPASASAGYKLPSSVVELVHLRGTNGFRLELTLVDHRQLLLEAHRGSYRGGEQSVDYFATTDRSPGTDIQTPIGRLGRVNVHFHPDSRNTQPAGKGCEGGGTTVERGHFLGLIAFRGERGYTRVRVSRARGEVTWEGARVCGNRAQARRRGQPIAQRRLRRAGGGASPVRFLAGTRSRTIGFEAERSVGAGAEAAGTSFVAYAHRRSAGLSVTSLASVFPRAETAFALPDPSRPASEAIMRPPAPFSGSATFRLDSPSSASWTGDLAVEMPNLGTIALTGPGTYSGICIGAHCSETLPPGVVSGTTSETPSGTGSNRG